LTSTFYAEKLFKYQIPITPIPIYEQQTAAQLTNSFNLPTAGQSTNHPPTKARFLMHKSTETAFSTEWLQVKPTGKKPRFNQQNFYSGGNLA